MKSPKPSTLNIQKGVEQPPQLNTRMIEAIKARKMRSLTTREYLTGIFAGDTMILSKAITLVESALPAHQAQAQEIIAGCLKHETKEKKADTENQKPEIENSSGHRQVTGSHRPSTIRIGITGVPGVGKSTFIEALGKHLTSQGFKLAVLAIDPSSSITKGSILGDKTRMEELANDPNAFIRPSPSAGSLGGVARKTREIIYLCEAAGYSVIFVETVGVGQSEITVHSMVDFFLLLMLSGAGDELQGIKRGIVEMADALIINKADGDNVTRARLAAKEYTRALHLFPPSQTGWIPVVDICSSHTRQGIGRVWEIIQDFRFLMTQHGHFQKKRMDQNRQALYETIEETLRSDFFRKKEVEKLMHRVEEDILTGRINPYQVAQEIVEKYRSGR